MLHSVSLVVLLWGGFPIFLLGGLAVSHVLIAMDPASLSEEKSEIEPAVNWVHESDKRHIFV